MRVVAKSTLKKFLVKYPDAEKPLLSWYKLVNDADWKTPAELKSEIANASVVGDNRVAFNIKGNDYRLVSYIDFRFRIAFVLWIGTHKQYDKIDVKTISYGKSD
jgi:mRNA interferase HigB